MENAELRTICTRKDKSVKVKRKSNVICFCEEEKKGEESQQKRREEISVEKKGEENVNRKSM